MNGDECRKLIKNWRVDGQQRGVQSFVSEFSEHLRLKGCHTQNIMIAAQVQVLPGSLAPPSGVEEVKRARLRGLNVQASDWAHMLS